MSWLIGAFDAPSRMLDAVRGLVRQTPSSLYSLDSEKHYLAAGGIEETCLARTLPDRAGWLAVGCGLERIGDACRRISAQSWENLLCDDKPPSLPSDGHFVAMRWDEDRMEVYTDPLGLRTLYYAPLHPGLLFSTRLDWLCRIAGLHELDFRTFGGHWLAFNQLSIRAPVHGVERLGPGGRLCYRYPEPEVSDTPWTPSVASISPADFIEALAAFSHPAQGDRRLSLGLSGGLDSRFLLALHQHEIPLSLHTFGSAAHSDVKIASAIADALSLPHRRFHDVPENETQTLDVLRRHVSQTQAMTPASAAWGLHYYPHLHREGYTIIDGGFGEAARRQFLNRLRLRGAQQLAAGQYDALAGFIETPRADLFDAETRDVMEEGLKRQMIDAWTDMPAVQEIGLENALDLFSIRTRLPNFYGYEQSRLDASVLNHMPFAQPSVLHLLFNLPLDVRKNGRFFRQEMRRRLPALAEFPLVKGDQTYPFFLRGIPVAAWTTLKSRLFPQKAPDLRSHFLATLKEFALDSLQSATTRQFPYDLQQITKRVEAYYAGERRHASFVDWWLAFEVWRQEVLTQSH